jgi:putative ABC transport system permease protein
VIDFSSLAWRNLGRRPARSAATLLAVALAVAALFSVLALHRGYAQGMRSELDRLGAHVLVVPKGCPYDAASMALHGASWPCYLQEASVDRVRRTPGVAVAAPVLMNALPLPDGSQAVYLGVGPEVQAVKRSWRIQGAFPRRPGELLVGSELARERRLQPGSRCELPGLPGEGGAVASVLAPTGGAEDLFIYLPLAEAQRLFHRPRQVTHLLVRLEDPDRLPQVVNELKGCDVGLEMNVVPVAHLFRTIQQLLRSTRLLLFCVALVALLGAGAGVGNTVLMSVTERTREIGVLRAVGASLADVFRIVWLETILLCLGGGIVGLAAATGTGAVVEGWLRGRLPFTPAGRLLQAEPATALACLAACLLLGAIVGAPAAWRAASLPPAAAIRAGEAVR